MNNGAYIKDIKIPPGFGFVGDRFRSSLGARYGG